MQCNRHSKYGYFDFKINFDILKYVIKNKQNNWINKPPNIASIKIYTKKDTQKIWTNEQTNKNKQNINYTKIGKCFETDPTPKMWPF